MCFDENDLFHWWNLNCLEQINKSNEKLKRKKKLKENQRKISLGSQYFGIYFTKREADCAYLLLKGYKSKRIAFKLSISHRTVECYIGLAKKKLNCSKTKDFIEMITKSDFLKNFNKIDDLE